jgi:hypothetical protein
MSDPNDSIPYGFCHCGCGERTNIYHGRPYRYLHNHDKRSTGPEYVEEDRGYVTPCWIWQRYVTIYGYGLTQVNRVGRHAHIVYYERTYGPVPKGLEIDHLCRIRACCNPDHLEAVTRAVNQRRGAATKLTWDDVNAIRAIGDSLPRKVLSEMFGVNPWQIGLILLGRSWRP